MSKTLKYIIFSILLVNIISNVSITHLDEGIDLMSEGFMNFMNNFKLGLNPFHELDIGNVEDTCEIRPNYSVADYYYFLPAFKAAVKAGQEAIEFSNNCFKSNKVILEKFTKELTVITIEASKPRNLFCSDNYLVSTAGIHKLKTIIFKGKHRIVMKNLKDDDMDDLRVNGVMILTFCQDFFTSMKSLFDSLSLYIGGLGLNPEAHIPLFRPSVPEYMVKNNVDFLERYVNIKLEHRGDFADKIVEIDEKEIKTGDFIVLFRLDGLDPLIMIGTGSRIAHCGVALWMDGELYVTESQDGWYWPRKGIQRNKYKDWVKWAHSADFNVALLPLREEVRARLDEKKALEFYKWAEGKPYGYHNFLFSWIDTARDNFPKLVEIESIFVLLNIFEKISKSSSDLIVGEAMNLRMNTKGLSLAQVAAVGARKGLTWGEILAIPEQDGWKYSDGENYVCSCYAVGFWKAAGVFGDLEMNATEFSPRDAYQLDIFDKSYKGRRPEACKQADPELEYCQIMGKYRLSLPHYSSITPYAHMNEKCPSVAPEFIRPEGC